MKLLDIYNTVKLKIREVEDLLHEELTGDLEIVSEMSRHVISGGGKRIRPALLCLVAKALEYDGNKDVRYAAVFEMVHTATLVHDDIIDNADTRRGNTVLNKVFGSTMSILYGDHLYNKAMEMAIRDNDFRIVRLINKATEKMITGEIYQLHRNFSIGQNLSDYLDLIERKTAWIFASCAQAAAILCEAEEETEKNMFEYGMALGMAFQIIDDYFDYASTEKVLGKPVGSDLIEGKITYPLLLLLEEEPQLRGDIEQAFEKGSIDSSLISHIIKRMKSLGSLKQAKEIALDYAQKAVSRLHVLPMNHTTEALKKLPEFVINRKK